MIQEWAAVLQAYCDPRGQRRLTQLVELAWRWQSHATLRTSDFLNFVDSEKVPDPTADRIRVMTVHQSKGLEFDIVVLPNLDEKLVGMPKSFVVNRPTPTEPINRVCRYRNENVQHLLPAEYQEMFAHARRHQISESLCVLYVAVTRAKHALHMIIAPSSEKEKKIPPTMAGLLRTTLTEPGIVEPEKCLFEIGTVDWYHDGNPSTNAPQPDVSDDRKANDNPVSNEVHCLPQIRFRDMSTGRSRGLQRKAPSKHAVTKKVRLSSVIRHGSSAATERGTLIHAWFELITWLDQHAVPDNASLTATATDIKSLVPDVPALITEFHDMLGQSEICRGLQSDAYRSPNDEELTSKAREQLQSVAHDRIRLEVHNEHPFAVLDSGEVINGFIDRLVLVYVDNCLVAADIVDFKTDTFNFSDEQLFQEKANYYRDQLQIYARVVSRLYRIPADVISTRLFMLGAGRVTNV